MCRIITVKFHLESRFLLTMCRYGEICQQFEAFTKIGSWTASRDFAKIIIRWLDMGLRLNVNIFWKLEWSQGRGELAMQIGNICRSFFLHFWFSIYSYQSLYSRHERRTMKTRIQSSFRWRNLLSNNIHKWLICRNGFVVLRLREKLLFGVFELFQMIMISKAAPETILSENHAGFACDEARNVVWKWASNHLTTEFHFRIIKTCFWRRLAISWHLKPENWSSSLTTENSTAESDYAKHRAVFSIPLWRIYWLVRTRNEKERNLHSSRRGNIVE